MKIIKIGFSAGGLGKTKGCEKAPEEIIRQLKNFYLNEEGKLPNFEIDEIEIDNSNIEGSFQRIEKKANEICQEERVIFLGGDHSISYPILKGLKRGLIVFDAHADMMAGTDIATHEDYLRKLVEEGDVKAEEIIIVGLRNEHSQERKLREKKRIRVFTMKQIMENGMASVCDSVMELANRWDEIHLSIDIDILDPAFAPGNGHPEPGGLSVRELLYFIQRIKRLKNLKSMDIVEINPDKDENGLSVLNGAKILAELR